MPALLEVKGVSVERQGRAILDDVSLTLCENDFITVIGPNGAGKTMLLKCLMGFFEPDAGRVALQPGAKVGYLPQRLSTSATMPIVAEDFIRLRKKPSAPDFDRAVEEAGAAGALRRPLHALSGGELQRVLLARALIGSPDLLVLDEPAQNLDVSGQLSFYKIIERIYSERKIGVLMVSHDLHMVMASTSQVVCLFRHVCCAGTPHVVARDPEFISLFGDDMAKMMAIYHHDHDHAHDHVHDADA